MSKMQQDDDNNETHTKKTPKPDKTKSKANKIKVI